MIQVMPNLFVGNVFDVVGGGMATVCATATRYVGEDMVLSIDGDRLYLNWVDARESKYFDYNNGGVGVVCKVLDFIEGKIKTKKVFVFCDMGISRSPSIAMLYMAKRAKVIGDSNYYTAKHDFEKVYFDYEPNTGIETFLKNKWRLIR
jgi:predicted protein tyrosine phosphatase